jgi:hypothetical protein
MMRGIHLDRRLALGENGEPIRPGILAYLAAGPGFGGEPFAKGPGGGALLGRKNGVATRCSTPSRASTRKGRRR